MQVRHHAALSAIGAIGTAIWTGSLIPGVLFFLSGTGIDLDHLYDYARYPFRAPLYTCNIRELFAVHNNNRLLRVYLFLHSWELILLLLLFAWMVPIATGYFLPLAGGAALHLIADTVTNPAHPAGYWLTARLSHRFSRDFFYRNNR